MTSHEILRLRYATRRMTDGRDYATRGMTEEEGCAAGRASSGRHAPARDAPDCFDAVVADGVEMVVEVHDRVAMGDD